MKTKLIRVPSASIGAIAEAVKKYQEEFSNRHDRMRVTLPWGEKNGKPESLAKDYALTIDEYTPGESVTLWGDWEDLASALISYTGEKGAKSEEILKRFGAKWMSGLRHHRNK